MKRTTKVSKYLNIGINLIILVGSFFYIYSVFNKKTAEFSSLFENFAFIPASQIAFFIGTLILLMLVNWGLESLKWKSLISPIYKISFFSAFKSILLGVFTGLFLPNRTGEWMGRIFSVPNSSKTALFVHTMIGNFAQLLTTLIMGIVALIYFSNFRSQLWQHISTIETLGGIPIKYWIIMVITIIIIFIATMLYLNNKTKQIKESLKYLQEISLAIYIKIFAISGLRYFVFTLQYLLMFALFSVKIPLFDLTMLISLYFLILAAIPSVVYTEVGIRGGVGVFLFGLYSHLHGINEWSMATQVVLVTLIVWLVNIIFPAIVGSIFLYRLKFFEK